VLAQRGGPQVRSRPWPKWPEHGEEEKSAVAEVIASGHWGGFPAPGSKARAFQESWARRVGTAHAIVAANGTVTLEVILRALGIEGGDEVIVPALTWVATAGAPVYINAVPVFADVEPDTLCIDPEAVEQLITPKTEAIIAVHLGSSMADVDRLSRIAERHGIALVEDCAHAHGAKWSGRSAGSFGIAGSFSFQSSKLLTCGEGGAITTSDRLLAERCQSLINCGRKEPGYDSFEGVLFGWNDRMTELQAALLSAQLARLDEQNARRGANVRHLEQRLLELDLGLVPQKRDPRMSETVFYHEVLLYQPSCFRGLSRDRFVAALEAEGVPADGAFYVPIPDRTDELFPLRARDYPEIRARYGEALSSRHAAFPHARQAARERTIWLHHALFLGTTRDVDDIVEALVKVRDHVADVL
jgi:dTDP-4-amino-4,6-dideoxygalactose transaminase